MVRREEIPVQRTAESLPDKFIAKCFAVREELGSKGKMVLKVLLVLDDGTKFTSSYPIPKALTGKGKFDKLLDSLEQLGIHDTDEMTDRTFEWEREVIDPKKTGFTGFPRYYPIRIVS